MADRKPTPTANFADVPSIELTPVESRQLAAYGYHEASGTLAIRFHGHGGKPGGLYHYPHSATEWAAFKDAPSKGSHFLRNIKAHADRYPCTRILETTTP